MSYLNEVHPELFVVSPRAGGIARIKKRQELNAVTKTSSKNVQVRGSKGTLKSSSRKGSRTTVKSTITGGSMWGDTVVKRSTPKKTTREYRIKKILSAAPWMLFTDDDEEENITEPPNPLLDAMRILSVTISTIMLIAAGHQEIPRQHLVWTLSYLECVKDDFGNSPPNITGIINNIKLIDNTLTSFFADDWDDDADTKLIFAPPLKSNAATEDTRN